MGDQPDDVSVHREWAELTERLLRAVGESLSAGSGFQERMQALLSALVSALNLHVAVFGRVYAPPGVYPPTILEATERGHLNPAQRRAVEEYFARLDAEPDPAHVEAVRRLNGKPLVVRRQDLIDDRAWYASAHVRNCRRRSGVDACIYTVTPHGGPHEYFGFSLHRAWGRPQFTTVERDAVAALQASLAWLFRSAAAESERAQVLHGLQARLRKTLSHLLDGASEKQAARGLGLSHHSVHHYVKQLHKAFGVSSRGELMARCAALGVTADLLRRAPTPPTDLLRRAGTRRPRAPGRR